MIAHPLPIDPCHRLVAILRGITTDEVGGVVEGLINVGFRAIEIPLNSPDAVRSIAEAVTVAERLAPSECLIGAGTVLSVEEVKAVSDAGGKLIVSPNTNPGVIEATVARDMVSLPGVFTPTEAHLALQSGASGLKFFPASNLGPSGISAIKATLPPDTPIFAVGGIGPNNFEVMQKSASSASVSARCCTNRANLLRQSWNPEP